MSYPGHEAEVVTLAGLIREAIITCWVKENPSHDNTHFEGLKRVGSFIGYKHLARELMKQGVRLPEHMKEQE